MKNYIIIRTKENKVRTVQRLDNEKFPVSLIKEKIEQWQDGPKPELIIDQTTIDILDFIFRNEDNVDLQYKHDKLETAIYEINQILERL